MAEKNLNPIQGVFKSWGMAPFSYWALSVAQFCLGTFMDGAVGVMLCMLGLFSVLLGLAHKAISFDEARQRSRGGIIKLPWSQKTTHAIVCAATMLLCAQLIRSDDATASLAGCVGAVCAALAGWLGSMVPSLAKP